MKKELKSEGLSLLPMKEGALQRFVEVHELTGTEHQMRPNTQAYKSMLGLQKSAETQLAICY